MWVYIRNYSSGDIMGHKRMSLFHDVNKFLDYRKKMVGSQGFEDSWVTDKKWLKENVNGFFSCKWCGQKMDAAGYEGGKLLVSCHKTLCPGNIDSGMALKIDEHKIDMREMTNQYLFNSRMKL